MERRKGGRKEGKAALHGNFLEAVPPAPTAGRPRGTHVCGFSPSTFDAADIGSRNESHLLGHRRERERETHTERSPFSPSLSPFHLRSITSRCPSSPIQSRLGQSKLIGGHGHCHPIGRPVFIWLLKRSIRLFVYGRGQTHPLIIPSQYQITPTFVDRACPMANGPMLISVQTSPLSC